MSKTKLSTKLRAEIINRDGRKCLWCGRGPQDGVKLHVDHVLPENFEGSSNPENLGTLCEECNLGKGSDYFGQYLLSTLWELKPFDQYIRDIDAGSNRNPETCEVFDGRVHKVFITFYRNASGSYSPVEVHHFYVIHGSYLASSGPDTEIRLEQKKSKARLAFMNKLRDYLFQNNGYLKKVGSNIVFQKPGSQA